MRVKFPNVSRYTFNFAKQWPWLKIMNSVGWGKKNILCVRAWGDCKAIRHAPFVVAFHCCSRSGIVQTDSGGE